MTLTESLVKMGILDLTWPISLNAGDKYASSVAPIMAMKREKKKRRERKKERKKGAMELVQKGIL